MKSSYFSSTLFAVFLSLFFASQGLCGLVLSEGDSYTFEFTSLLYDSEYTEDYFSYALIRVSSTTPEIPQFMFSIYEDSLDQSPIRSGLSSVDPEFGVQSVGYFNKPEFSPWQDFQGIFFIKVTEGSIELESITAAVMIGNSLYQQNFPVPIPSSFIFAISGFFLIISGKSMNKKTDQKV